MKISNENVGNRTRDLLACSLNQLQRHVPPVGDENQTFKEPEWQKI